MSNLSYQSNFVASKRITKGRAVALHNGQVEPCNQSNNHRFIGIASLGCNEGEAVNLYDMNSGAIPIYIDNDEHFEAASIDYFGVELDEEGNTALELFSPNFCLPCQLVSYDETTHIAMGLFQ